MQQDGSSFEQKMSCCSLLNRHTKNISTMEVSREFTADLDHLSVSEAVTTDPWTEIRLHGKLNFSGWKNVDKDSLNKLINGFSESIRTWIEDVCITHQELKGSPMD